MRAAVLLVALLAAPFVLSSVSAVGPLEDDAGSGQDAPGTPLDLVRVQPGVVYDAAHGLLDADDHYAFLAQAGDAVHVRASGEYACVSVVDAAGAALGRGCYPYEGFPGELRVTIPSEGVWFLRHATTWSDDLSVLPREAKTSPYRISFALNGEAPYLFPFDPQNDAGSGRDAPPVPVPLVWIQPGEFYQGTILGVTDRFDHYAFQGHAGDVVSAHASGPLGCLALLDASGAEMDSGCPSIGWNDAEVGAVLPADGTYYLRYGQIDPEEYTFSLGINGPPHATHVPHPIPEAWTLVDLIFDLL
jgi:hypothetical protein